MGWRLRLKRGIVMQLPAVQSVLVSVGEIGGLQAGAVSFVSRNAPSADYL